MLSTLFIFAFNYLVLCNSLYPYEGVYDKRICFNSSRNSELSCSHQSQANLQLQSCLLRSTKCMFAVNEVFKPTLSPFTLNAYQYKEGLFNVAALNLSFSQPEWKSMMIQYENNDHYEKICRLFHLDNPLTVNNVFFDCLLFDVSRFENNNITLRLQMDDHFGGSYTMRIPLVESIDSSRTKLRKWQVFFFIHKHYYESTGKLFVTFLRAPFKDINYKISSFKCTNLDCSEYTEMYSEDIQDKIDQRDSDNHFITAEMKPWILPGNYFLGIEIVSSECGSRCAISLSPVYEKKDVKPLLIIGILLLVLLFGSIFSFLIIYFSRRSFKKYLKESEPIKVLLIYHPHSKEFLEFLYYFASVLKSFGAEPLMIDKDLMQDDPNSWTKLNLCKANKILFLLPNKLKGAGVTIVQNQWNFALRCFSANYFQKSRDISKFATVELPFSSPVTPDDDIFFLRRFHLPRQLSFLLQWIHDSYPFFCKGGRYSSPLNAISPLHFFVISPFASTHSEELTNYLFHVANPSFTFQPPPSSILLERSTHHETKRESILSSDKIDSFNYDSKTKDEGLHLNTSESKYSSGDSRTSSLEDVYPQLPSYADVYQEEDTKRFSKDKNDTSSTDSDSDCSTSDPIKDLLF